MSTRPALHIYFLMILPPLFWAGNSVLARGVADLVPPITLSFWRWVIALTILFPFSIRHLKRDWPRIRDHWRIIVLLGFLGITSFNTLLYSAAHSTTVLNITLMQAIMPAIILLISFFMFNERVSKLQIFAVFLCICGTGYVVIQGNIQRLIQLEFVKGDLLMLLAVIFYAFYSALLRKAPKIHPLSFLFSTFTSGAALLLPFYLWENQASTSYQLSSPVIFSFLYLGIFPSILAYLYWNRGIRELGANRAGLYINMIPLFAALLAIAILGERLQSHHLLGGLMICSGLGLFNLPGKRHKENA